MSFAKCAGNVVSCRTQFLSVSELGFAIDADKLPPIDPQHDGKIIDHDSSGLPDDSKR